jgi:hypothetical protein
MKKQSFVAQFQVLSRELSGGTQESYGKHVRIACLQPEFKISEYEVDHRPLGRDVRPELM